MPVWSDIQREISDTLDSNNNFDYDGVRRKYLIKLHEKRDRSIILYATDWINPNSISNDASMNEEDKCGFMETIHGLTNKKLDIILHSPGGSAESVASVVDYIREKFDDVHILDFMRNHILSK